MPNIKFPFDRWGCLTGTSAKTFGQLPQYREFAHASSLAVQVSGDCAEQQVTQVKERVLSTLDTVEADSKWRMSAHSRKISIRFSQADPQIPCCQVRRSLSAVKLDVQSLGPCGEPEYP